MLRPQMMIMLTGAFLIIVGVGLIVFQMWVETTSPGIQFNPRSLNIEGVGAKASITTTYVGLIIAAIGSVLEIVGYLASKPWGTN